MSTTAEGEATVSWPQLVLGLLLGAFSGFSLIFAAVNSFFRLGCEPGLNGALVSPFAASDFLWLPLVAFLGATLAALLVIPKRRALAVGLTFVVWCLLWSAGVYSAFVAHELYPRCHVRMP